MVKWRAALEFGTRAKHPIFASSLSGIAKSNEKATDPQAIPRANRWRNSEVNIGALASLLIRLIE